ncbi:uncharacterized protein LOC128562014 [Nycticebus coucang]|uniref:uncharacterized protein LOC128562014 n=1 Tax=Nycticebus coucang TaxID=9470 RepID=UPI00234C4DAD|nr:uncharacterized protein LOC128562014 [Nycticebus coucang]
MRCDSFLCQSSDRMLGSSPCKPSPYPRLFPPRSLSYSLSAVVGREKEKGRRLGREWGLSPSDPGVRGAVQPDVLGVGPLSVAEDLGVRPLGPKFPGFAPRFSLHIPDIRDWGPSLFKPGFVFHRISDIWDSEPCVHQYLGFIAQAFKYRVRFLPFHIYGVQTAQSEIRDSTTVSFEEGEDWTERSDQVVTPSPPEEASRARPSRRAKAEEEVARGEVSLPLSLLGRAAGGPQAEAEALGHHSDPYQGVRG